jgi:hypothetical protein
MFTADGGCPRRWTIVLAVEVVKCLATVVICHQVTCQDMCVATDILLEKAILLVSFLRHGGGILHTRK